MTFEFNNIMIDNFAENYIIGPLYIFFTIFVQTNFNLRLQYTVSGLNSVTYNLFFTVDITTLLKAVILVNCDQTMCN